MRVGEGRGIACMQALGSHILCPLRNEKPTDQGWWPTPLSCLLSPLKTLPASFSLPPHGGSPIPPPTSLSLCLSAFCGILAMPRVPLCCCCGALAA